MIYGALYGALAAFVIYAVTYLQAMHDREMQGQSEAAIRLYPLPALVTLIICVLIGAAIGAYHG